MEGVQEAGSVCMVWELRLRCTGDVCVVKFKWWDDSSADAGDACTIDSGQCFMCQRRVGFQLESVWRPVLQTSIILNAMSWTLAAP